MDELSHLMAIRERLARERGRLANATTAAEREFRAVQVAQAEKEERSELALLERKGITVPPEMSADELAAELAEFGE